MSAAFLKSPKPLGVAESTVRSHLGRLFEKTGAKRHADLVKLVAGFASPLLVRRI
jgi:hypothetical protein